MSKQAFDSFREGPCLCGAGQITRHVESTDYPFGVANVSYSLDCSSCSREWRLEHEHGTLVNRQSEKEYLTLSAEQKTLMDKLISLAAIMVTKHFAELNHRTKKAELTALQSFDIYNDTYAAYTKARRAGKSIGQIACPLHNEKWLLSVCSIAESMELQQLLQKRTEVEVKRDAAQRQIIRKRVR